jgi:heptosyltransferase-2/heptosyltransferase-3
MPPHGNSASASPLVVRFGALGDMILLTPLLHKLHQRYGKPCLLLGSGAWMQPLFDGHPDVGGMLQLRSRRRPYLVDIQQWRLVAALRQQPFGPVYVCDERAIEKVRWLLARAGIAKDRCVFVGDYPMKPDEHWVDRFLRFGDATPAAFSAEAFPCNPQEALYAPNLKVSESERADLMGWLEHRGIAQKPLVLLQPGNKRTLKRGRWGQLGDDKTWPMANWAELIRAIAGDIPGAAIVLCGAPPEAGLLNDIRQAAAVDAMHVAADDLPLRRLFALLERANGMISIDTGPAHAAAALGCPLVVLYGAASRSNWLPRSPTGSPVLALGGPPYSTSVSDIAVDAVLTEWHKLDIRPDAAPRIQGASPGPHPEHAPPRSI